MRQRYAEAIGYNYEVSTHAPLRGATDKIRVIQAILEEFQPTHPCGVRLYD